MRHETTHSHPIVREYHPTVDGSMGQVRGFLAEWGNRRKVVMFGDYPLRNKTVVPLWTVRFGLTTIEVMGILRWRKDNRGPIREFELFRNDGREFPETFRVYYLH